MAEQKQSEEKIAVGSNELPVLPSSYRFDGRNYLQWAQVVRTTIKGKKKLNHIEGDSLAKTDPKFEAWDDEDSLIMSWLWHSMTPEVSRNCMFFSTAKEIWEYLKQTYSLKKNTAACYEIQTKIFNTKQGSLSVTDYYGTLNGWWLELDQYQNLKMACTADTGTLTKAVEEQRIFKFLHGLNSEFDPIRVQILGKDPLPSLSEVFHTVREEETRRSVMLEGGSSIEGSALAIGKGPTKGSSSGKPLMKTSREERYCIHCRKIGHTKETCFKLHGKEKVLDRNPGLRGAPQRRANQAAVESESLEEAPPADKEISALSKSELESLRTLLQSLSKPSSSSSLVMTGKNSSFLSSNVSNTENNWIIDSGATHHMTPYPSLFSSYSPLPGNQQMTVANGSSIPIVGSGNIQIQPSISLKNVLHIPKLTNNLLSASKLAKELKCAVTFVDSHCVLQDRPTGKMIGYAEEHDGLYYLQPEKNKDNAKLKALASTQESSSESWSSSQVWLQHRRLGHPPFSVLKTLFPSLFTKVSVESFHCDVCQFAKHHRTTFPSNNNKSSKPFDLIHSDVWGPTNCNISGAKWFVTFIDDCTRVSWVFLMKDKSEVFQLFVNFHQMVQTQFGCLIKRLRSDNGREYVNQNLSKFLTENGIVHEFTCVDTPQQNGVAERKNRHILEVTRALLFQMSVPKSYWGEAVLTATYLINRLPSRTLNGASPVQFMTTFHPSIPIMVSLQSRVFGCSVFVHVHSPHRGKLDPRAIKCIFIGYTSNKKGYKCYHPESRRVYVSMDVTFNESESFYPRPQLQGEKNLQPESLELSSEFLELPQSCPVELPVQSDDQDAEDRLFGRQYQRRSKPDMVQQHIQSSEPEVSDSNPEPNADEPNPDDLPIALRKGKRSCAKYPISQFVSTKNLSIQHQSFISAIDSIRIPTSVQEALKDESWVQAMNEEMGALEKNDTWEIVERPTGKKAVGCRWIYTVKYQSDGTMDRYKARLVAKGYSQTYGIDYEETFAPVAKMNTVRIILSLAAHFSWEMHQFDVKNAFLHGNLEEEVYMEIPPGYEATNGDNKVCRLKKALYGLKQSPRAWFGRLSQVMVSLGYRQSQGDHTLFIKHSQSGKLTILLVYVDDMIITGDDEVEKQTLREKLATQFEMKDLGKLKYFLGIEVAYSEQGIFISQRKYVLDLLKETGKLGCKPTGAPIEQNHKIGSNEESPQVEKSQYQRLVGKLIYLAHTRPDIAYAVSVVSQFMHDPRERHLQAVDKILQYLKTSPGRGLLFKRDGKLLMEGYTDSDYAGSIVDRRSTSGYCIFLGGNLVSWRSKKQNVVARSSAEAEFRAMAQGVCELLWMKIILDDLKIKYEAPMKLFCDNKSAISIAHNPVQHDRTKHIEIDRHFIKEKLERATSYIPTGLQLADVFTKGLPIERFQDLTCKLGMIDIHLPA